MSFKSNGSSSTISTIGNIVISSIGVGILAAGFQIATSTFTEYISDQAKTISDKDLPKATRVKAGVKVASATVAYELCHVAAIKSICEITKGVVK